jgi:N-acetylglucosamine kinase-like BadF-type ATPase
MSTPLVLAIDGGQTSTKALIADTRGVILGRGIGSPCDHITGPHGYERNRAAIHSATLAAVADAGVALGDIVSVGMGLTSAPDELAVKPLFEARLPIRSTSGSTTMPHPTLPGRPPVNRGSS